MKHLFNPFKTQAFCFSEAVEIYAILATNVRDDPQAPD